ncbi:MAG: winged helix DNA-binding protein [Chloroflexi bacterium]|nr:winged helix DNA-binding protein [Chloroflexota bacterium]
MVTTRRSSLEIMADMLRAGGTKTAMMYGGNLSYSQTVKYLKHLVSSGLLEAEATARGRNLFHLTPKGQKFLEIVEAVEEMTADAA